jgi:hypothetical protein
MSPRARILGLALFCFASAPVFASGAVLTVEDVLRLHTAGVSEEIIISEIIVTETVFELSVEDLLRLQSAGLSDRLIQFMVDTGLPAEDRVSSDGGGVTTDGDSWINVIEEDPEPEVVYNVSLDYRYPYWWYDNYWYDYWYYDCHYAPYRSNWSFSIGVWYPGWYTWGGVYVWPACGYRDYCWGYGYPYYGYPYGACQYYPTYYYPGHASGGQYALSTVKYKTNGGSQGVAVASRSRDLGLQMRDGRAVTSKTADLDRPRSKTRVPTQLAHAGATVDQPVRSGRNKAHADAPTLDRKTRRPSGGAVVTDTRRTESATPVRAVRSPATDAQPPKKVHTVRRTTGVTGSDVRAPATKSGSRVEAPATRVKSSAPATRGTVVKSGVVRSAPTRSRAETGSAPRAASGVSRATRSSGGKGR